MGLYCWTLKELKPGRLLEQGYGGMGYVAKPNHNGEPVVGGSESPFRTKAHPTSY